MDNSRTATTNPQGFFKTTAIIHAALLIGQVLFGIAVFSITNNTGLNMKPGNDPLFYVALLLIFGGMLLGSFLYKQQLTKLADDATLKEKLSAYQTALIMRCAPSEGGSMFCIVCYMLTGNPFYLMLTGLNILYFIWMRPTKQKIEDEVSLNYEDKAELGW
ncbi:MAG TPA: hypothetical protein VGI43_09380 [Mucilaginibacter sp.]|jgi:hypothetical protein